MPKQKISEFSSTPANNTDIDSIFIGEGMAPSNVNDAIRELMSQLKDWQSGTSNDPYVIGSSGSLTLNQGTANTVPYLNGSKVVTSGTALTFDGSNLGLGVTPSAWGSNWRAVEFANASSFAATVSGSNTVVLNNAFNDASGFKYKSTAAAGYYAISTNQHAWYTAPSGTAGNAITFTQAMTLDASGNLGVGTSSPLTGLTLSKSGTQWTNNSSNSYPVPAGRTFLQMEAQASQANWFGFTGSYGATSGSANLLLQVNLNNTNQQAGNYIGSEATSSTTSVLTFGRMFGGATTGSNSYKFEDMRIDSSGRLLVGTTSQFYLNNRAVISQTDSTNSGSALAVATSYSGDVGNAAFFVGKFDNNSTTSQVFARFLINAANNANGQINANGAGAAAFGSWSDRRLKENITDLTSQLANVMALRPVEFDYIESEGGGHQTGFIAQEMQDVYPDAVGERAPDGMLTVTGWDKTTARLVKAIQEQQATIESLKARLDAANL